MSTQKLRQLLRLLINTRYSNNRIAKLINGSPNTVKTYRKKLVRMTLSVADMELLADSQLTDKFRFAKPITPEKRQPDWAHMHKLMQAHHQTLIQLWEEYRSLCPSDAYSYSQFTHCYREYVKTIDVTMRQYYSPGEVCFVDFAGKRIPWTDTETSAEHFAEIFVGVLGYSQLVFAIALRSQKLEDWLEAHQKMFTFYGGVTQLVVPDNLKSAVTKAGKFPEVNLSYQELAEHYGCVIEPARVRRPQDKSLAEIGVLLVTRWITVALRRRRFFSVAEINVALNELLEPLNLRPFKRYEGNRKTRFDTQEKMALSSLPAKAFDIGRWIHQQKVNRDYHVYVKGHAYSVPYELTHQYVDIKVCQNKIEIYFQHKLVATHLRNFTQGGATTEKSHRPKSHQAYAEQSKSHFEEWANNIGEAASSITSAQFFNKPEHSMLGSKACSQLQKLARQYGHSRFERACQCAIDIQSQTVSSVRSILQCHIDESSVHREPHQTQIPFHHNVRGAEYYITGGKCDE